MQNEFKLKLVYTNTVLGFLFAKNYDSTKEKNTQVGEKEGFFFNEENVKFKILLVKKHRFISFKHQSIALKPYTVAYCLSCTFHLMPSH